MADDFPQETRKLLTFYRGVGLTDRGYRFHEVLGWPDDQWEQVHDFIQWVFPTLQRSGFHPEAPVLTPEAAKLWESDPTLAGNFGLAFERWLRFIGVGRDARDGFAFGANPNPGVWEWPNHNWLRMTRVLTCLRLLGRHADATNFGAFLLNVAAPRYNIDEETLGYWRGAVG